MNSNEQFHNEADKSELQEYTRVMLKHFKKLEKYSKALVPIQEQLQEVDKTLEGSIDDMSHKDFESLKASCFIARAFLFEAVELNQAVIKVSNVNEGSEQVKDFAKKLNALADHLNKL